MSGFSTAWLDLREPADHAARSHYLVRQLAARIKPEHGLTVLDMGCGTGSNLRALAPSLSIHLPLNPPLSLPLEQSWILVDHDQMLLEEAARRAQGLAAVKVQTVRADLSKGVAGLLQDFSPDLVTASAFFDLVSESWIGSFAEAVTATEAAFYTTLTYDGIEEWLPLHPLDGEVLKAFHAHQSGQKGFGAASGPEAVQNLVTAFGNRGYRVETARSDWNLTSSHASLIKALLDGQVKALRETGLMDERSITEWAEARALTTSSCRIGHLDCLAYPC
jgi:SAM-dependent methyltransferase